MYTPRHLQTACRKALADHKILVLIGARQTGKSTLARSLVADAKTADKVSLNLDDPYLRDQLSAENGLVRIIEEQIGKPWRQASPLYLLLDEAQKAPALFEVLKALYDERPEKLRVILTGSSALAIHDPVAESLAGRVRIHHLFPFTLSEGFAHSRQQDPTQDELPKILSRLLTGRFTAEDFTALIERSKWHAAERRQWTRDHLLHPLFPEPCISEVPETWVRDYLATYLEKDIQSLAAVGNLTLFRSALAHIAASTGSTLKWETAARRIATTSVTLRKYAGLMEQTFNLLRLAPFSANPFKRVVKAPKLYFTDSGLLWGLRGFEDRRLLESSGQLGAYAELAAIIEIAKWCALEPTSPELRFWSKTAVSEVDLVVSNRGYHIPFEIKLGEAPRRRWLRGLDAFENDHRPLGLEIPYRFVLHSGEPQQLDDRTYALPLWLLA